MPVLPVQGLCSSVPMRWLLSSVPQLFAFIFQTTCASIPHSMFPRFLPSPSAVWKSSDLPLLKPACL
ncbi:hypothetical protein CHARACLAT_022889 [Characodon lateralis]|uniref:Secreted protein n=1 Tax=Characodon lateralis TaxID=208331 RepID=A0ABU7EPZ0_9TELE|nr:hypothetical protein [Characodon lateralis]